MEQAAPHDVADALQLVMSAHGVAMDDGRIQTVALLVHGQGWVRAELREAAVVLANSPTLRDTLRYGGTLCPADFEDVRRGTERREKDEDGNDRILTTLTGFALRVRRARLYSYREAMDLWSAAGSAGPFGSPLDREIPGAMFDAVLVPDQEKPMWRLAP